MFGMHRCTAACKATAYLSARSSIRCCTSVSRHQTPGSGAAWGSPALYTACHASACSTRLSGRAASAGTAADTQHAACHRSSGSQCGRDTAALLSEGAAGVVYVVSSSSASHSVSVNLPCSRCGRSPSRLHCAQVCNRAISDRLQTVRIRLPAAEPASAVALPTVQRGTRVRGKLGLLAPCEHAQQQSAAARHAHTPGLPPCTRMTAPSVTATQPALPTQMRHSPALGHVNYAFAAH